MKLIISLMMLLFCIQNFAQSENENYDAALAEKLGADDYGMKMYVFVVLKSGENKSDNKAHRDSCFQGHMTNIEALVDQNKLIVAGPMGENSNDFRGIFILDVPTVEEASTLMDTDPAIASAYLKAELYPWYGSAALPEYLEASDKVWKLKP